MRSPRVPRMVFLLVAVILGTGGFFLLLQYKPWMQFFQNPPISKPTIPRNPNVSTQFTQNPAEWTDYRGHNGLYFKYPPQWRVDELTPNKMMLYTADLLQPPKGAPIVLYRNDEKTYASHVEAVKSTLKEIKERPVEFAGMSGVEINGYISSRDLGDLQFTTVVLNNNEQIVVAEYTLYEGAADYSQAFQDVLSTLEVTTAQNQSPR